MNSVLDISVLPVEVLEKIFHYLSVNDKLNVCLVRKQWLNVIDQPKLIRDISIHINSYNSANIIYSTFERNFSDFIFNDLEINLTIINFLLKHGQHIRRITFINCNIVLKVESECKELNICPNLKSLKFEDCFLDIFSHLPCLKELKIETEDTFIITDRNLYTFQKTMPNLEKLELHHPAASANIIIQRFYSGKNWTEMPSDLILTLPAIHDFIRKRSKTLNQLSIRNKDIQPKYALNLFKDENLKLQRLSLNKWFECVNIIPEICLHQTSVTELDLTSLQISDAFIKRICSILPFLKALTMQNNLLLDSSIADIFQLKCLQSLGLESCSNIRLESFNNALQVFQLQDLRSLDLTSTKPDDECVRNLLRQTPKLRYLNLTSCLEISDATVHIISVNLVLLRFLALRGCKKITDQGLKCSQNTAACLSNIRGLTELHLTMCPKITVNGLLESVKFLELKSLHLQDNYFNPIDALQQLKTQNPSLQFDPLSLTAKQRHIFCPSDFTEY